MPIACALTYVVRGIARRDDPATVRDLRSEIEAVLGGPGVISVAPTPHAIEVRINVTNIEPFDRSNFEAFIYEQVLWHSVNACCHMEGDGFHFELQSAEYKQAQMAPNTSLERTREG